MKYPNLMQERILSKIERLRKQNRMLYSGAIQAVINQNHQEIQELQELLEASFHRFKPPEDNG